MVTRSGMLGPMNERLVVAILFTALASCKEPKRDRPTGIAASAVIRAPGAVTAEAPAPSASACEPQKAPSATASAPAAAAAPPAVASGDVCRVTRGPLQMSFTGQATLWIDEASADREMRVVFNDGGVPRAVTLPAQPAAKPQPKGSKPEAAKKPERLALSEPATRLVTPACAVASGQWFCADKAGAIHRTATLGQEGAVVAQGRVGSPIAAAPIAGSHVAYAYLADRKTTEGATTMAFAALDDNPPQTLSEDGAGATFVTLAPRGEEVIAMYIDARRVLTPVHARVITANKKLAFGPDAVIFVGGGSEGRAGGVIAQGATGSELALVAMEKDMKEFGLAAIRIEEQPRDDAKVTWSIYPAAMERAPVAATQGAVPVRVLRVRPASAEANAKKVLELGELDAAGAYRPSCPVAEGAMFGDLAIAIDRQGALWMAYTDADGTWVEKRGR